MKKCCYFMLFLISCGLIASGQGSAATLTLEAGEEHLVKVKLDEKEALEPIEKKMLICFIEQKKKFACGLVIEVKPGELSVKVKQRFDRLKDGMEVTFITKQNPKKMVSTTEKTRAPTLGLRLMWTPIFLSKTRAAYNTVAYQGANATTIDSLWQNRDPVADGSRGTMFLSFNGEVEIKAFNIRFGGSYKNYPLASYESTYDLASREQFLRCENTGTAFSIYADYVFLTLNDSLTFAAGLEGEISQLELLGTKGNDKNTDEETLFQVQSSRTITSLRLPVRYDYSFNKEKRFNFGKKNFLQDLGLFAGLTLAIPFADFGSPDTVKVASDPVNGSKVTSVEDDLKQALHHHRASWAFDTQLGGFFMF